MSILGKLLPSDALSSERLPPSVVGGLSLLLLATYSLGDVLILLGSEWSHLYGVLGVSAIRWEETIAYLGRISEKQSNAWHALRLACIWYLKCIT